MLMKTQGLSGFNGSLPVLDVLSYSIFQGQAKQEQASNDSIERKAKEKRKEKNNRTVIVFTKA